MKAEILMLQMTAALLVAKQIGQAQGGHIRMSDCRGLIVEWSYLYFHKGTVQITSCDRQATHLSYRGKCLRL